MTKRNLIAAAACGALFFSALAQAQYVGGNTAAPEMTVKQALACRVDDTRATLTGKILRHIKKDDYLFSDGTGEIQVEIDDKDFRGQRVDANTRVRLVGKIDAETFKSNEFDVKRLDVLR